MSTRAYLALGVVHHKADLVDGLLLFAPRVLADDRQRTLPPEVTLVENPELLAELSPDEVKSMQGAVIQSREIVDRMRADAYPALAMANWDLLRQLWEPANWGQSHDAVALPALLSAPSLIVTRKQVAIVGYQDAWSLLESLPRGSFAVLDRAGNLLEIDRKRCSMPWSTSGWIGSKNT